MAHKMSLRSSQKKQQDYINMMMRAEAKKKTLEGETQETVA